MGSWHIGRHLPNNTEEKIKDTSHNLYNTTWNNYVEVVDIYYFNDFVRSTHTSTGWFRHTGFLGSFALLFQLFSQTTSATNKQTLSLSVHTRLTLFTWYDQILCSLEILTNFCRLSFSYLNPPHRTSWERTGQASSGLLHPEECLNRPNPEMRGHKSIRMITRRYYKLNVTYHIIIVHIVDRQSPHFSRAWIKSWLL